MSLGAGVSMPRKWSCVSGEAEAFMDENVHAKK